MKNIKAVINSFLTKDIDLIEETLKENKFGSDLFFNYIQEEIGINFKKSDKYFGKMMDKYNWMDIYGSFPAYGYEKENDILTLEQVFNAREIKHLSSLVIKDMEV